MKMTPSYISTFEGLPVNGSKPLKHGLYRPILRRMLNQLKALHSYYSRITVVRIDLHLPRSHTNDNKLENSWLSEYIKKCKADLGSNAWGNHSLVIHGWVKEVGHNNKPHYHIFIGFKALYSHLGAITSEGNTGLWHLFESHWKATTGGSVSFTQPHTIDRQDNHKFAKCFYHLSYLAKERSKDFGTGSSHRRFDFSRLKSKYKCDDYDITMVA